MAKLKKFKGPIMVHKHRGNRWTVRVADDEHYAVFDWMVENFGEEDYVGGPWARTQSKTWWNGHAEYDITDEKIVTMMLLRWS